jgi:8-oxo-dGTP pyrophosphatase MutT (NUDIX family)
VAARAVAFLLYGCVRGNVFTLSSFSKEADVEDHIECLTVYGRKKLVPREALQFRPGSYALMYRDGKVLLVRMRLNGKYCLPGGGIEPGERAIDALRREVMEETGLAISVGTFIDTYDSFAYFDPEDKALHCILLCWACMPIHRDGSIEPSCGDPEEGVPAWIDVASLREEDCHGLTWDIVCLYLMRFPLVDPSWTAVVDHLEKRHGANYCRQKKDPK